MVVEIILLEVHSIYLAVYVFKCNYTLFVVDCVCFIKLVIVHCAVVLSFMAVPYRILKNLYRTYCEKSS